MNVTILAPNVDQDNLKNIFVKIHEGKHQGKSYWFPNTSYGIKGFKSFYYLSDSDIYYNLSKHPKVRRESFMQTYKEKGALKKLDKTVNSKNVEYFVPCEKGDNAKIYRFDEILFVLIYPTKYCEPYGLFIYIDNILIFLTVSYDRVGSTFGATTSFYVQVPKNSKFDSKKLKEDIEHIYNAFYETYEKVHKKVFEDISNKERMKLKSDSLTELKKRGVNIKVIKNSTDHLVRKVLE